MKFSSLNGYITAFKKTKYLCEVALASYKICMIYNMVMVLSVLEESFTLHSLIFLFSAYKVKFYFHNTCTVNRKNHPLPSSVVNNNK